MFCMNKQRLVGWAHKDFSEFISGLTSNLLHIPSQIFVAPLSLKIEKLNFCIYYNSKNYMLIDESDFKVITS